MVYCTVPGCKRSNKSKNKRFLFNFPKKDELLQKWLEAIPSLKKPIKSSWRVCQYHFDSKDVLEAFSHTIGGKEYLIERQRARLKPNAVPTKNLGNSLTVSPKIKLRDRTVPNTDPTDDETTSGSNSNTARVPVMVEHLQVEQVCNENNLCSEKMSSESEKFENAYKDIDLNCDSFTVGDDCSSIRSNVLNKVNIIQVQEISIGDIDEYLPKNQTNSPTSPTDQSFDLFDNVFEVVLPTTLWGVHRSPNQKLVMFVCIDEKQLNINKMLTINDTGDIKIYVAMRLIREECWPIEDLTPDHISNLLEELHVMHICLGANSYENCEIVIKAFDTDEQRRQRLCTKCL